MTVSGPASVRDLLSAYVRHSPFCAHLGLMADAVAPDRVRLSMPFAEQLVTVGDVVHGGAISAASAFARSTSKTPTAPLWQRHW
jgi:acyl-coenzyme A thioesterase PaaI-like protein